MLHKPKIINKLRDRLPNLLAIYAFGSQIDGTARPGSDLDMAVLVAGYVEDTEDLWGLAYEVSEIVGIDEVDMLDLRAVDTVMQYQIITTGERWWIADEQADIFEAAAISDMQELNDMRAPLLEEITLTGKIYAR